MMSLQPVSDGRRTSVVVVTKIWVFEHKIGYNSACTGNVPDSCTKLGVFEVGQFNGVIQVDPRPTSVATVTKI